MSKRVDRVATTGVVVGLNALAWTFGGPLGGLPATTLTIGAGGATAYYNRQAQYSEATGKALPVAEGLVAATGDVTDASSMYTVVSGEDPVTGETVTSADRVESGAHLVVGLAGAHLGVRTGAEVKVSVQARILPGGESLALRVAEIHGLIDPIGQAMRTTAILSTKEGARIVAAGGRDLTPNQRSALTQGEIPARLPNAHAEITVLHHAVEGGLSPAQMVTSRQICPECAQRIESMGGRLTGPTSAAFDGK